MKRTVFLLLFAASCSALSNSGSADTPSLSAPEASAKPEAPSRPVVLPKDPASRIFTNSYVGAPAIAGDTKPLSEKLDKSIWRIISGDKYRFLMFEHENNTSFKYAQAFEVSSRYSAMPNIGFRGATIISNTPSILILQRGQDIIGYALLPGDKLADSINDSPFTSSEERQQDIDSMYKSFQTMITAQPGKAGDKHEWISRRITNVSQYDSGDDFSDYLYYYK